MKNVQFAHNLRSNIQERGRGCVRQGGGGWQSKMDGEAVGTVEDIVSGLARRPKQEGQLSLWIGGRRAGIGVALDSFWLGS